MKQNIVLANFGRILLCLLAITYSSGVSQTGTETSDLSVASVRKALASERFLIASHPKEPVNYIHLAYTLIDAGMGEQARRAVDDAARLAPTNAVVFSAQGWVLHHNNIGVDYGTGFDYAGALNAFQKSIELDPKNLETRESLANLLEFNRDGVRYAPDAELPLAIDAYRYVKKHQHMLRSDVVDNLAVDLFYAGRYQEAINELAPLPGTREHLGILLASVTALRGSSEAVTESSQIQGGEQRRKDALNYAAEGLWNKRLYSQAADLLTASLPDTENGPAVAAKIQLFRDLKPYVPHTLSVSDPSSPVLKILELASTGTLTDESLHELMSRHSYIAGASWSHAVQQHQALGATVLALMKRTGLPRAVVVDIVMGKTKVTAPADPGVATAVRVQAAGSARKEFFVVLEDGQWKLAASEHSSNEVGDQALFLLSTGKLEAATAILNWYDSGRKKLRTDEQQSTDVFSRVWDSSNKAEPQANLLAAAALADDPALLRPGVPEIIKARDMAKTTDRRENLDLLLASIYLRLEDAANARSLIGSLLKQSPDSMTVLQLAGRSYALDHNWAAWRALLDSRMKTGTPDRQLLLEAAWEAAQEGDYNRARELYQRILDGSQATAADSVNYAWFSLFEASLDDKAMNTAETVAMNGDRSYRALLTIACLDAARGNTAKARQELLDAMSSAGLVQPDAGIWYGFGRIYEQYGESAAIVSAYQRTLKMSAPESVNNDTTSVAALAKARLKTLVPN